jgi:hypothetical protein
MRNLVAAILGFSVCTSAALAQQAPPAGPISLNSTSIGRPATTVPATGIPALVNTPDYRLLVSNDLGMHCGDLDDRIATILPPFNVVHAQVLNRSARPALLDPTTVNLSYAASASPDDPALSDPPVLAADGSVFKTNFWDSALKTYGAFYPAGALALYLPYTLARHSADVGLPVPNLERLYLGDGQVELRQQTMPSVTKFTTDPTSGAPIALSAAPYRANARQPVKTYETSWPMFKNFPFGYVANNVKWFSAEGIPMAPFDDFGRENPFPLVRFLAKLNSTGATVASLDAVVPVSGETDCKGCHLPAPYGNGLATGVLGSLAVLPTTDPKWGHVPQWVSEEWAADINLAQVHDFKFGTSLYNGYNATTGMGKTPVACQSCHYTPALDLLHLGPQDGHGLTQTTHESMSRAMHWAHANFKLKTGAPVFPNMPPPTDPRRLKDQATTPINAYEQKVLEASCYQCHPGKRTQCLRGTMEKAGAVCQDCHGQMRQVANDFSRNKPRGAFIVRSDFYTNATTPRVPWANEPTCGSCHTGDANSNLAATTGVISAPDGIRLLQAYRSGDGKATPILPVNLRFAEPRVTTGPATGNPQLYRLSVDSHGGVFCEGCHGPTHAEWPTTNPKGNDNVTATQLTGHEGRVMECDTCHLGTLAATLAGPHGMHPVGSSGNSAAWSNNHGDYVQSHGGLTTCAACHGKTGQGTPLAVTATSRPGLPCHQGSLCPGVETTITLAAKTTVTCTLCHGNPFTGGLRNLKRKASLQ